MVSVSYWNLPKYTNEFRNSAVYIYICDKAARGICCMSSILKPTFLTVLRMPETYSLRLHRALIRADYPKLPKAGSMLQLQLTTSNGMESTSMYPWNIQKPSYTGTTSTNHI